MIQLEYGSPLADLLDNHRDVWRCDGLFILLLLRDPFGDWANFYHERKGIRFRFPLSM